MNKEQQRQLFWLMVLRVVVVSTLLGSFILIQFLSHPVLLVLPEGSYRRWRAERVAGGAHDGQIKPPNLLPPEEFHAGFQPSDFITLGEGAAR